MTLFLAIHDLGYVDFLNTVTMNGTALGEEMGEEVQPSIYASTNNVDLLSWAKAASITQADA